MCIRDRGGDLASVRSAAQTALKAQIKSINLTTDDSETPTPVSYTHLDVYKRQERD